MSTLIQSGVDIRAALELTASTYTAVKDVDLFKQILTEVIGGVALAQALKNSGKFSSYEYHSVNIGEETGKLGDVLSELAQYFKSKIKQRQKLVSALTYPILVLTTSFGAIFFMIKFVVPMFADVFTRFGGKLPGITASIIAFSNWLDSNLFFILLVLLLLIAGYVMYRRTPWYKKWSSLLILKLPVAGDIVKKIYLARFANTMRLLTGTDTPLLRSLKMVEQMINFYPIQQSLAMAEKDILSGSSLSESLSKHQFYPAKFIQLIKIAEEVNKVEHFFEQLANQYTEEVAYKTNAISSVLEPLIIICLGLAVGIVLIAMYLPMFQMSNSF